jgi:hypothetical protein
MENKYVYATHNQGTGYDARAKERLFEANKLNESLYNVEFGYCDKTKTWRYVKLIKKETLKHDN